MNDSAKLAKEKLAKAKSKKSKSASDLYKGTNRRLTIMVVLMSIWTVFLIAGSIAVIVFALQAYNAATELKTQLKDKSSTLYQVIKEDVSGQLQKELETVMNSSTSSMTEALKNSQQNTTLTNYQNLLK